MPNAGTSTRSQLRPIGPPSTSHRSESAALLGSSRNECGRKMGPGWQEEKANVFQPRTVPLINTSGAVDARSGQWFASEPQVAPDQPRTEEQLRTFDERFHEASRDDWGQGRTGRFGHTMTDQASPGFVHHDLISGPSGPMDVKAKMELDRLKQESMSMMMIPKGWPAVLEVKGSIESQMEQLNRFQLNMHKRMNKVYETLNAFTSHRHLGWTDIECDTSSEAVDFLTGLQGGGDGNATELRSSDQAKVYPFSKTESLQILLKEIKLTKKNKRRSLVLPRPFDKKESSPDGLTCVWDCQRRGISSSPKCESCHLL